MNIHDKEEFRVGDIVRFMRASPHETYRITHVLEDDIIFMRSTRNPNVIITCCSKSLSKVELS
jgi:hypothetical protein